MIDISEYVTSLGEQTPAGVTITITACGDVGQGKSRALEVILRALAMSKLTMLSKVEQLEVGRAEVAVVQMVVGEPWKSSSPAPDVPPKLRNV